MKEEELQEDHSYTDGKGHVRKIVCYRNSRPIMYSTPKSQKYHYCNAADFAKWAKKECIR